MGILKKFTDRVLGTNRVSEDKKKKNEVLRRCYFEVMEQRRVLSADPVIAGVTYLEGDTGQDITPDHFEVTFEGGAETTQMTQFVINGDQDESGNLTDGDMFFDINDQGPGTAGYHAFQFDAANSVGVAAGDIESVTVSADGLSLTVQLNNFEAGDKFAFTIDVDEVERFRTDKIASGVEFEGSFFEASFVDENYTFVDKDVSVSTQLIDGQVQPQQEGIFYDEYDQLLGAGEQLASNRLNLSLDNADGQANRTAAAIDAYDLVPKPITISGTVYHDENANCVHESEEFGISGVDVTLQLLNEQSGDYEMVASTTTDADGNYEFGLDLELMPGTYRLVETQPDDYLSVGAVAGSVDGDSVGAIQSVDGEPNIIADIHVPLGGTTATNYDFCEVKPASISGTVFHDRDDDGSIDPGEEGISNVLIRVTRVGAKDGGAVDPFADTAPVFVRTDANGFYSVDSLPPGVYEIVEINNYPSTEVDPLAAFIDGKDSVGRVGSTTIGTGSNDRVDQVVLCAGEDGVEYNFGELKPASISGFVSLTTPEGDCVDPSDPNHIGIAGVEIELYDEGGNLVATTQTNSGGYYEFSDLRQGVYTIVEVQPNGYLDAGQSLGRVDGSTMGAGGDNTFTAIALGSGAEGVSYNFCETLPAEICGTVWHDANDNGIIDAGEDRIGGVTVQLFDANGELLAEVRTNAQGEYCFKDLMPGEYCVKEIQPVGFNDGKDSLGTVSSRLGETATVGTMTNDEFCKIDLRAGDQGTNYNFGEIQPGSISGRVHGDANGDCVFEPGEGDIPLEGVQLILFDQAGNEVSRTTTDAQGRYSFDNLRPGTYTIREITPEGYLNGGTMVGQVDGTQAGVVGEDLIGGITLTSGQAGVNYDFCEHIPAELCGTVYHDRNNNGVQDSGEEGIGGVRMILTDAEGNVVAETFTDGSGDYCFRDLIPGEYCVTEIQPEGYIDGKDRIGVVDGQIAGQLTNDKVCNIELRGGNAGENYDFGELQLAEISGMVHTDVDGNCIFSAEQGEIPLAGVTLELLDANGAVISTTVTDSNGRYSFGNLLPGTYSVRQVQPDSYFTGGETVGDGGGEASENLLSGIVVSSGQKLTQYDFCENEAAEIHGRVWEDGPAIESADGTLPANYRALRDGVYQNGSDTPLAGVRMQLYYFIDPTSQDVAPRPVTLGEVLGEFYGHMGTTDPNAPVWIDTNANGEYSFRGLQAGNYVVLESQPEGYFDSNDTAGTTTGFTFNSDVTAATAPQALLQRFDTTQIMDAVVNIRVNAGGISTQNNFSEVRLTSTPEIPPPLNPPTPQPPGNPVTPQPGVTGLPGLYGARPSSFTQFIGTSRGAAFQVQASMPNDPYTWHLSVINGGVPRGENDGMGADSPWQQVGYISNADWTRFDMDDAVWTFTETKGENNEISPTHRQIRFGMIDGTPLAGDFDGDGTDEVAVFKDGYWMIDLNRDGRWDDSDLLARLGDAEDRPVVGDWDGDGKDDIGIFGPMWAHDPEAIERDPGLPNPANRPVTTPKNIPPEYQDSSHGARVMKLTSFGRQRADVVDHVFGMQDESIEPVTGDWNGNGIRSIGTFEDGFWRLDVNGDGRFDFKDVTANFGDAGDIPLVGDFDGDGIEEIAVYRAGTWIIDSNGNRELDATDKTFQMGGVLDKPVVGDWDGDGTDEPGLYTEQQTPVF